MAGTADRELRLEIARRGRARYLLTQANGEVPSELDIDLALQEQATRHTEVASELLDHALKEWRHIRRRTAASRPSRSRGRSSDWWAR